MFAVHKILGLTLAAQAAQVTKKPVAPAAVRNPVLSTQLMDHRGLTRFHYTTRTTFTDGQDVFSSSFAWAHELRAAVRFTEGLAAMVILPFGMAKIEGTSDQAFLGNLTIGIGGGARIYGEPTDALTMSLGGEVDAHLPTTTGTKDPAGAAAASYVAAIRGYETQLFVPKLTSFRARGSWSLYYQDLRASLEVSLIPAILDSKLVMLMGGAARISYLVADVAEPFVEVGMTRQVSGPGEIQPPLVLSPGVRFRVAEIFDPALFLSINFEAPTALMLGVDLAVAFRPSESKSTKDRDVLNRRDFFP